MTAAALPALLVCILGATTVMKALSERRQLQAVAQTTCNRAVKPTRMINMTDAQRTVHAQQLFDALASDKHLTITERTVTSDWLQAQVTARARVAAIPGWGEQVAIPISVSERCTGVPPYPALGDVVLSSNFRTPTGNSIALVSNNRGITNQRWGIFTASQVGWDGQTGWGIEIQDWSNGFNVDTTSTKYTLPAGWTNPYVIELDSGAPPGVAAPSSAATCGVREKPYNSSMYKNFELHPGTYRFSLNYRARILNNPDSTNKIAVYLEGTKPVLAKTLKLTMNDGDFVWRNRSFNIEVTSYGLYRLHVAAEGCSDGSGGLFNDLKLEYVRRPSPEYNDPAPPATN